MVYAKTKVMKNREIDQESFERLLGWLDEDRDRAGEKYVKLHGQLSQFFAARRCPERLTEETLDRVARRLSEVEIISEAPISYCIGVARFVALEYYRNPERNVGPLDEMLNQGYGENNFLAQQLPPLAEDDPYFECLDKCLQTLESHERILILAYYQADDPPLKKKERSGFLKKARTRLREKLGMTEKAMNSKTVKIRKRLKQCVEHCIGQLHTQQNT